MDEKKSILTFFAKNPWVGLVNTVITVISLPLGFILFFAAKEDPDFAFYENPISTTVVRSVEAGRLTASYDGIPVTTDVTATQIAIWNAGKRPIRRSDILQPIVLRTSDETPILEAKVLKSSRELVGLKLDTESQRQGKVVVDFDILERNDGAVIQIVFAGGQEIRTSLTGALVGQKEPRHFGVKGAKPAAPRPPLMVDRLGALGLGLFFVSLLLLWAIASEWARRKHLAELEELTATMKSTNVGKAMNKVRIQHRERMAGVAVARSRWEGFIFWLIRHHAKASVPALLIILLFLVYLLLNIDFFGPPFSF